MYKVVYADGCSLMAGAEVDTWFVDLDGWEWCYKTWPSLLQAKYFPNAKFYPRAVTGASNRSIRRRTIYHVSELLKKYRNHEILVCIMWTSMYRREVRVTREVNPNKVGKEELNYINLLPTDMDLTVPLQGELANNNRRIEYLESNKLHNFAREMYKSLNDPLTFFQDSFAEIEATNLFLQDNRIRSMQCFGFGDHARHEYARYSEVDGYTSAMVKRLKTYNTYQPNIGFYEWATSNKYDLGPGLHPLEDAHKDWSRKMSDFYKIKPEY
jgi:hypothetical protein